MKTTTTTQKIKEKTTTTTNPKNEYLQQIITACNIQSLGEQTALKALKTIHNKSQDKHIWQLIKDFYNDTHKAKNDISHTFSNAYDIAQIAICFYLDHIGQPLNASANNGELDKNKQPIDIYRACLRKINRYILNNKNKAQKTVYLQDIDENGETGEYIAIPPKWDMPTITDYKSVIDIIKKMRLSATEKTVLSARLRGYGYDTIAKKLSITKASVQTYIKRIQAKAIKIDIMPKAIRKALQVA